MNKIAEFNLPAEQNNKMSFQEEFLSRRKLSLELYYMIIKTLGRQSQGPNR